MKRSALQVVLRSAENGGEWKREWRGEEVNTDEEEVKERPGIVSGTCERAHPSTQFIYRRASKLLVTLHKE